MILTPKLAISAAAAFDPLRTLGVAASNQLVGVDSSIPPHAFGAVIATNSRKPI
jgi:hypothetical protein